MILEPVTVNENARSALECGSSSYRFSDLAMQQRHRCGLMGKRYPLFAIGF
jgi:hypothetical protein